MKPDSMSDAEIACEELVRLLLALDDERVRSALRRALLECAQQEKED